MTFSHGWPLNSDAWDGQLHFFGQKGFRVVAQDRRGHGRSTCTDAGKLRECVFMTSNPALLVITPVNNSYAACSFRSAFTMRMNVYILSQLTVFLVDVDVLAFFADDA